MTKQGQGLKLHPFVQGWLLALGIAITGSPGIADELLDEPVETLEVIEVSGTALIQEKREISTPMPDTTNLLPLPPGDLIRPAVTFKVAHPFEISKVARDPIADVRGVLTPVRPAKAERPSYPQFAREQGWEGTVVLRIKIKADGSVDSIATRKSSGFPILDESALRTVKQWRFEPAKDGEFPIPVTVDLPIRFDLER